MKNIELFKHDGWFVQKYDGRKRIFRGISHEEYRAMSDKHCDRVSKNYVPKYEPIKELWRDIEFYSKAGRHTKRLIVGNKHIYWVSPVYGHRDYNKSIFADNTPRNRRKAELINRLIVKHND